MKSLNSLVIISIFLFFGVSACKGKVEKQCENAYKMVEKCLPKLAGNKKQHIRVCKETQGKSSTDGTIKCAKFYSDCGEYKACLAFSSKCSDSKADAFKACIKNGPTCIKYTGKKFNTCVKCIVNDGKSGSEIASCVSKEFGEKTEPETKKVKKKPVVAPKAAPVVKTMTPPVEKPKVEKK
jgi:hypothetical protein